MDSEIRKGVKTFILNADSSINLSDVQLQSFFHLGFEVYPLQTSRLLPLIDQVACLAGLFRELILFFNIDIAPPAGQTWVELLRQVGNTFGSRVRIGVFHHEADAQARASLERSYLMDVQIQAGCVFIDRRNTDTNTLKRILVANQAAGRRKAIRTTCAGRLNFLNGGKRVEAKVVDISLSHFVCSFRGDDPELALSSRIRDVQMMVGGPVFHSDAVILLKRLSDEQEMLYVFGFVRGNSSDLGLTADQTNLLVKLIHRSCTESIQSLVQASFQRRWKHNTVGRNNPIPREPQWAVV